MKNPALQAYRNSLRATLMAFKGDTEVLSAARAKIKQGILDNKSLTGTTCDEEIQKLEEVNKFLVQNVVQGQRQQDGKYQLNFHSNIELGDNETIKQGNKNLGSLKGTGTSSIKKCSDKS